MKKRAIALFCGLILCLNAFAGCQNGNEENAGTSGGQTDGTGETADTAPETGKKEDETLKPKLTDLRADGGYAIAFSPDTHEYTVKIPDGRPRIPRLSASGETGAEVKICQATAPDGEKEAVGGVTVTKDGATGSYRVTFVRSPELGFQLQYDDRYVFTPDGVKAGDKVTYKSSDTKVLKVDDKGNVTVVGLSDTPVTVTASVNGKTADTLTVDKTVKAPLNIFLIIGQSNAYGYHDVPAGADHGTFFAEQRAKCDAPDPGTVYCDDAGNAYDDVSFTGWYDLSVGRNGFSPALGREWYAKTGEKTFMLQTALGSTPLETWMPDPSLRFFGIDCYGETVKRFNYYKERLSAADSGYEINRIYAFWLQGETCEEYIFSNETFTWADKYGIKDYEYVGDWYNTKDPRVKKGMHLMTVQEYYDGFLAMYEGLVRDVGLQFMGILPVRAMTSVSTGVNRKSQQLVDLVPSRAAQFALNFNENGNIAIVTLQTEIGRTESYADRNAEGWGYLGCNNIHYNQIGYNALGRDSADQVYGRFSFDSEGKATDIRILDANGSTVLDKDSTVKIFLMESRQVTAIALPLSAEDNVLTFTSGDPDICTVDAFGKVTVTKTAELGDTAVITVSNGNISKSFTVLVG